MVLYEYFSVLMLMYLIRDYDLTLCSSQAILESPVYENKSI